MHPDKSLDEYKVIAALLHDVHNAHGLVFNTRSLRLTLQKVRLRLRTEGIGFLTKTLPRLGKAFDKANSGGTPLNSTGLGFKPQVGSELPRFLGEFFNRVFHSDGTPLQDPCCTSVRVIREILYLFSKYKLPYSDAQEQQVIAKFERTEQELTTNQRFFNYLEASVEFSKTSRRNRNNPVSPTNIAREAKILLNRVFSRFDPSDIYPKHGPGAVATKQRLWDKYLWSNVSERITNVYPFDEYFCSSMGHVCDRWQSFNKIASKSLPARVVLVPKDSRGPRLISAEPVDFQWVQQGLGNAIVRLVESHYLTKDNVHFTDQGPNRIGALWGSESGRYATLDLNEASDRVSLDLVRLLFPEHVYTYLEACRSSSTVLPNGKELELRKFAPMGSCLCFPILALTIWAILTAGAPDTYTRERILVYGDDVIVPTAHAVNAMEQLESFGLKVNRDKSCTGGFFRESCGMDAFKGVDVTPVRLRTVLSSAPRPDVYTSWISYANSFFDRQYYVTYNLIVGWLTSIYGYIPGKDMFGKTCPSLNGGPHGEKEPRRRWNKNLQKFEFRVREVVSPQIRKTIDGWSMLLRYFAECGNSRNASIRDTENDSEDLRERVDPLLNIEEEPFSVSSYTSRKSSILAFRWR